MTESGSVRRIRLPLDVNSANERARQAAVLSDPVNLRIMSDLAADTKPSMLPALLGVESTELGQRIGVLVAAGLLIEIDAGEPHLTADAWVRFGRLLSGQLPPAQADPTPPLVALPPAVSTIIQDLAYRFQGTFNPETVSRYVVESFLLLSERANVRTHLMILTARYAADRLEALASVQGLRLHSSPEVLFVCVQNAGRSQIAGAFLRHLAGDRVHVRTAGSAPASEAHPRVIAAMDEIGIPVWGEFPKPLTDEVVRAADYVITMGCGDACPVFPGRRYLEWELDDPLTLDEVGLRRVRDEIGDRVRSLLTEMG